MRLYSHKDVDKKALRGARIAVLGYGSQGRAHALNLRDSGYDVVVGVRKGDSWNKAKKDGLKVMEPAAAVKGAQLVAMLVPDMTQKALYRELKPPIEPGATLLFAHGFNIHFNQIKPRKDLNVVLIAPKGPGDLVRRQYQQGRGVPCLIAVAQNATKNAKAIALAYADGIGGTRGGVLETTFAEETETDLFGEQAVLCGGATELVVKGYETLVEAGYQPAVAYYECLHELKLIVDLLHEGGITKMHRFISETAKYGDLTRGPRVVNKATKKEMKKILSEIQQGKFARQWIAETKNGRRKYSKLLEGGSQPFHRKGRRAAARAHALARVRQGLIRARARQESPWRRARCSTRSGRRTRWCRRRPATPAVLYIDLHLVHEVTSPQAFSVLRSLELPVRRPGSHARHHGSLHPDHDAIRCSATFPSRSMRPPGRCGSSSRMRPNSASSCSACATRGAASCTSSVPELGASRPGMTIVCGDSHTSTHGAFGALAFGIGSTEVGHVLATQCLLQRKPKTFAINVEGRLPPGVTAKDLILAIIGKVGVSGGTGHVFEYRGSTIRALSMDERMTICNMSIEAGARAGMIAPDEVTFAYLRAGRARPQGADWDAALARWRTLESDPGAAFDRSVDIDAAALEPMITYGTNPGMVVPIGGVDPALRGRCHPRQGARLHGIPAAAMPCSASRSTPCSSAAAPMGGSRICRPPPAVLKGRKVAAGRASADRAGLAADQARRRGGGTRRGVSSGRRRLARVRLLHVPWA